MLKKIYKNELVYDHNNVKLFLYFEMVEMTNCFVNKLTERSGSSFKFRIVERQMIGTSAVTQFLMGYLVMVNYNYFNPSDLVEKRKE